MGEAWRPRGRAELSPDCSSAARRPLHSPTPSSPSVPAASSPPLSPASRGPARHLREHRFRDHLAETALCQPLSACDFRGLLHFLGRQG